MYSRTTFSQSVSPTSIRSRILKVKLYEISPVIWGMSFTHVDPFEDTESLWGNQGQQLYVRSFTHVDPFEDTESQFAHVAPHAILSFTHVDPFEDTESIT